MKSPHSGLLAGVLDWGCLYRADMVIPLGTLGWPIWLWGWLHYLCWGYLCTWGWVSTPGFPPVKSVADKFLVFAHCLSASAGGDWFQSAFALSVWVGWLFCDWPGLSGGDLQCLLGSLCLVLMGGFYPACWQGLMDDETSPCYIFLFVLLLIPFLVIGLCIKANI